MKEQNEKKFGDVFNRILQIDVAKIGDEEVLETLSGWDSFNALSLVTELEKEFSVKFKMGEISKIKTLNDLKEILRKNSVEI